MYELGASPEHSSNGLNCTNPVPMPHYSHSCYAVLKDGRYNYLGEAMGETIDEVILDAKRRFLGTESHIMIKLNYLETITIERPST